MAYEPRFTIRPRLLTVVMEVAVLRERIQKAAIELSWIPALQKDTREAATYRRASSRHRRQPAHSSNKSAPLRKAEPLPRPTIALDREALNYFHGLALRSKKNATKKSLRHEDIFKLQSILVAEVMDQGQAGRYRSIPVRVGKYFPPASEDVSGLMFELLEWWNKSSTELSPILSSAIIHYRFEAIHPFADGNGRTGRALALWELYRRGFDTHHIFSVDEYYWEDRARYYREDSNRSAAKAKTFPVGWNIAPKGCGRHWKKSGSASRSSIPGRVKNWCCAQNRNDCSNCSAIMET